MQSYTVGRAAGPVPLDGSVAGTPWERVDPAPIDVYRWAEPDLTEQYAEARALYDEDALYLQYRVEDAHIVAAATGLNGPVWRDSAVEFFARPDLDEPNHLNFEANSVGTFLVGWGDEDTRTFVPEDLAASYRVEASEPGPATEPSTTDESWWLAAALPFDAIDAFTGLDSTPESGTEWRANFHRCGGGSASATWNPIETPERDYHRPEFFGRLRFA